MYSKKLLRRTTGAAMLGSGIGALKGVSANEKNPYADVSEKSKNITGGALGGAAVGATAGFVGQKALNGVGKLFKKSEMEVPHEDDKEIKEDEKSVRESPNEEEKKNMINSITKKDELNSYKEDIEKRAKENFYNALLDT